MNFKNIEGNVLFIMFQKEVKKDKAQDFKNGGEMIIRNCFGLCRRPRSQYGDRDLG